MVDRVATDRPDDRVSHHSCPRSTRLRTDRAGTSGRNLIVQAAPDPDERFTSDYDVPITLTVACSELGSVHTPMDEPIVFRLEPSAPTGFAFSLESETITLEQDDCLYSDANALTASTTGYLLATNEAQAFVDYATTIHAVPVDMDGLDDPGPQPVRHSVRYMGGVWPQLNDVRFDGDAFLIPVDVAVSANADSEAWFALKDGPSILEIPEPLFFEHSGDVGLGTKQATLRLPLSAVERDASYEWTLAVGANAAGDRLESVRINFLDVGLEGAALLDMAGTAATADSETVDAPAPGFIVMLLAVGVAVRLCRKV